jgi:hypothetical protein
MVGNRAVSARGIDATAVCEQQRNGRHVQGLNAALERFESRRDISIFSNFKRVDFNGNILGGTPDLTNIPIGERIADICQNRQPA